MLSSLLFDLMQSGALAMIVKCGLKLTAHRVKVSPAFCPPQERLTEHTVMPMCGVSVDTSLLYGVLCGPRDRTDTKHTTASGRISPGVDFNRYKPRSQYGDLKLPTRSRNSASQAIADMLSRLLDFALSSYLPRPKKAIARLALSICAPKCCFSSVLAPQFPLCTDPSRAA